MAKERRRLTDAEFADRMVWDGPPTTGAFFYKPGGRAICGAKSGTLEGPNGEPVRCQGIPSANGRCFNHSGATTNPGRPSDAQRRVTAAIIERLEMFDEDGVTEAQELAESLLYHAKGGNGAIAKIVIERSDGPVKQEIDLNAMVKPGKYDLSKLSNEELATFEAMLERVTEPDRDSS